MSEPQMTQMTQIPQIKAMEDYVAANQRPVDKCLADVWIGIKDILI